MKKGWSSLIIWGFLGIICIAALLYGEVSGMIPSYSATVSSNSAPRVVPKQTVKLWYTDDDLTRYLENAAVRYNSVSGMAERMEPVLCEESDLVKAVYEASVKGEDYPDIFILSNDSFEKAYLSGLTATLPEEEVERIRSEFPEAAVNAVTYRGNVLGYPWYFDTAALLYNKTFLRDWAEDKLLMQTVSEDEEGDGETAEAVAEVTEISPVDIELYMQDHLPRTIEDILIFSNDYNAPDTLDAIFKWDVNDVFYNYFFAGASMNVGSPTGDDPSVMDIYNERSIRSLKRFQLLNQFFSFESRDVDYDQVLSDFIEGKILFTVCTTDAVRAISEKKASGECTYDFGSLNLPDIAEDIKARPLSVTNALVINGYSEKISNAAAVTDYLINLPAEDFYASTGKVAAVSASEFSDPAMEAFKTGYATSTPVTKMAQTGNFKLRMEAAFMRIWDGEDPNQVLYELSADMKRQTGASDGEQEHLKVAEETFEVGTEE